MISQKAVLLIGTLIRKKPTLANQTPNVKIFSLWKSRKVLIRLAISFITLCSPFLTCFCQTAATAQPTISLFPIISYDQRVDTWLPPTARDNQKSIFPKAYQQARLLEFYKNTYSSEPDAKSAWNKNYVEQRFTQEGGIGQEERSALQDLSNAPNKDPKTISYAENFRPYTLGWIQNFQQHMNIAQFDRLRFNPSNRAIVVDNALLRSLPTDEPVFYSHLILGQGYPFDRLQVSAVWVGTAVYILGKTQHEDWTLVMVDGYIGWLPSNLIAKVDDAFVKEWQQSARKNLIAITQTQSPVYVSDCDKSIGMNAHEEGFLAWRQTIFPAQKLASCGKQYAFTTYIGTVLPGLGSQGENYKLMIPARDLTGRAYVRTGFISKHLATPMPWSASKAHFAHLLKSLQGRPYGWGNLYFYNDCSAELKALFTPFGLWLPRNSRDQPTAGRMVDMATKSAPERMNYLLQNGKALSTIIYIGGHVLLYVGSYDNPRDLGHPMPLSYQQMWGLRTADKTRLSIIGKSVFLPLLLTYPEDPPLRSELYSPIFQISHLDQWPVVPEQQAMPAKELPATN